MTVHLFGLDIKLHPTAIHTNSEHGKCLASIGPLSLTANKNDWPMPLADSFWSNYSDGLCVHLLQELLAPIVETVVAIGCLFGAGVAHLLHPVLEQLLVLFQHQILSQNGVGLKRMEMIVSTWLALFICAHGVIVFTHAPYRIQRPSSVHRGFPQFRPVPSPTCCPLAPQRSSCVSAMCPTCL